jgi:hypothetical protein
MIKDQIAAIFPSTNVEITIKERFYRFSDGYREYYFAVVVKELQKAWKASGVVKSQKEVDTEMRDMFLYHEWLNPETGEFVKTIHTLRSNDTGVDQQMMKEFIEHCIIWALQNLDWAIPYPGEEFEMQDMTREQILYEMKQ